MHYFLGVDSGGTKAEFVLGNETQELARVRTGTIKRMKVDAQTAEANLLSGLQQLTEVTGVAMDSIASCCIGTAGETVPLVTDWLRRVFARHVSGELYLIGDVEVALDSVFFGQRGILILSGTGSNIAGRTAEGKMVTAGGWGPALADQGSGHYIGVESLRRGFLAIDRQLPTRLLDLAQSFWNLHSLNELIEFANANPAPEFSRLVPMVLECAVQGDVVAMEVLERGGVDLANLASLLIERMRTLEAESQQPFTLPTVAVAGSILTHVTMLREALVRHMRKRYPSIVVLDTPADPPAGALWNARHRFTRAAQTAVTAL
ncbi:N-acetylglucosamine kinase [Telmatobacter bradus]|uniref:N-acetylglucosamine kinase n=1 Tax=Telmatobacter bradus TaxID=474953 RepID=UPI003B42D399